MKVGPSCAVLEKDPEFGAHTWPEDLPLHLEFLLQRPSELNGSDTKGPAQSPQIKLRLMQTVDWESASSKPPGPAGIWAAANIEDTRGVVVLLLHLF